MTALEDAADCPKVLLIGPSVGGGGAENRLRLVAQNLFGGSAALAVLKKDGLETVTLTKPPLHLGWAGARSYPVMIRRLRRYMKQNDFDAVLAFGFYPNALAWASTRGLRKRPALILTEITRPSQAMTGTKSWLRRMFTASMRRIVYPAADLFAANSQDGLSEVIRDYGVVSDQARRIPNLVDPSHLEQLARSGQVRQNDDGAASICIVARLVRLKRVDTLLQAAAGLPPDLIWRIDVIGDGEERTALEAQARKLGIADQVRFHGWVQNPYPVVSRARVCVLCSEYEGFSNSVLEAMALHTPVITSFCSSDARAMCRQGAAQGFEVGDYLELGAQLERILRDEELRRDLTGCAWRYIARHTVPVAIGEYENLIREAVKVRP